MFSISLDLYEISLLLLIINDFLYIIFVPRTLARIIKEFSGWLIMHLICLYTNIQINCYQNIMIGKKRIRKLERITNLMFVLNLKQNYQELQYFRKIYAFISFKRQQSSMQFYSREMQFYFIVIATPTRIYKVISVI